MDSKGHRNSKLSALRQSALLRDGATLISGNVWAQLIAFASYFVLTRLFSKEDFGVYNMFYSYIDVLVIVSTCKYEMAVVLTPDERQASAVSCVAMRLNMLISLLLLVVAVLLVSVGYAPPQQLSYGSWALLLVPFMVFFCGTSRVYAALCNRARHFRQIALSEVVGSSSTLIFKILFGLPRWGTTLIHGIGLPLGTLLGKMVSNVNYYLSVRRMHLPRDISRPELRSAARQYGDFPKFVMPKDLINSFSYNLPFLWLAFYFDKAEVGLLGLAMTVAVRPINMFNTAFEKLFYVRVVEKIRANDHVLPDIARFVKYLVLIALPIFVLAFLFAEPLLVFCFGDKWAGCGWYVRVLLPWVFVMLPSTSLMFISNVFGKQRTEFWFYVVLLLLRVAAITAGIIMGNFRLAIALFAASGATISLALLVWYLLLLRRYERSL